MATVAQQCLTIVKSFTEIQDMLLGAPCICYDGKAGNICALFLDEEHGIRVGIAGHPGKWPLSTVKTVQLNHG